jgi:hypothetical protein
LDRIALLAVGAAVGLALARTGRRRLPPVPAQQPQQTAVPAPPAFPARSRWERGAHVAQVAATAIAALALLFTAISTYQSAQYNMASETEQAIENLGSSSISTRMAALHYMEDIMRRNGGSSAPVLIALTIHITERCQDLHKEKYPPGSVEFVEVEIAFEVWVEDGGSGRDDPDATEFAESCVNSGVPDNWP